MSNVRLSWAKNSILTTVIDDFFDIGGSREELLNFIQLVGRYFYMLFSLNLDSCYLFSEYPQKCAYKLNVLLFAGGMKIIKIIVAPYRSILYFLPFILQLMSLVKRLLQFKVVT